MGLDLDTGKLFIFLAGLILLLAIETVLPKRSWPVSRLNRLLFHGAIAAVNTVIVRLLVFVPFLLWVTFVEQHGWGLSRWLGLTDWWELVASLVVLDLFDYFWHRANHHVRFLWRFHKAHHADTSLDVTTALRFHPGELLISILVKAVWIGLWGPTAFAWFFFEGLVSFCAQFHHSNIDFSDRIENRLSLLLVTPRFHAAHHAVDREYGDANFSAIFSVWDRLFLTFKRPGDAGSTTSGAESLGLPEARNLAFSARDWIVEPFSNRNLDLAGITRNSIFENKD